MPSLDDIGFSLVFSRLVQTRPVVRKEGDLLIACSDWKSQLMSLGFGGRKLVVDPKQKIMRMIVRRFWFFRSSRRIEFDWVGEILYGYWNSSLGWGAGQPDELFTVAIKLKTGETITLFRFFGEGDFVNNSLWPDWMYWEDAALANYTRGNQERESLLFADVISRMVGVQISNRTP